MAKLIVLALAALVAFVSAHTTIVTTTIEDENPISWLRCKLQTYGQELNNCQRYLQQQGQSSYDENQQGQQEQSLRQCCNELQRFNEQCQCEAVKKVFLDVQQMQQQQGQFGAQQIRQLKQKAQNLPNQCNLQTRGCEVGNIITTTTISEEDTYDNPIPGRGSQQCSEKVQRRSFDQCQRYIEQALQSGSPRTLLMSVSRQGRQQQQQQQLRQCCNELENIDQECQCEAMQEVYRQAKQQHQQQQGGRRGGQQQDTQQVQQMVENLRNQCDLQVQQCRIPSSMF